MLLSLRQDARYEASAEVLLTRQNLAAALTDTPDFELTQQADRFAQTQADLAEVPTVARRVLDRLGLRDRTPQDLLRNSSVEAQSNSDLLEFTVNDANPLLAQRLATEYARQFTRYRSELDTGPLERARKEVEERLSELRVAGQQGSPLYASLVEKEQQLRTMEVLRTSTASLVRAADKAGQVQPRPVRNGILGLALGLVLGIGLAFLWEALDTRIRTGDAVAEALGLPLLARIPEPPRRLRKRNELVMLEDPRSSMGEPFRLLRTNLDFVNLERGARSIMVTSALKAEGKSTTIANLAVALVRAGRRVLLVDLDLRNPLLHTIFGLPDRPGLTEVVLGHASLDEALAKVPVPGAARTLPSEPASPNGRGEINGILEVLPCGSRPPDPGEFVGTKALAALLEHLQERADIVLIDTSPALGLVDPTALSASVDAIAVVAQQDLARRPVLRELKRVLDNCRAVPLGVILTGAAGEDGYGYGYGYGYGSRTYGREEAEPVR